MDGDKVYSGILGGHFIGNNKSAMPNNGISSLEAHSEANQNINNLKYIDSDINPQDRNYEILRYIYPDSDGVRKFYTIGE